LTTTDLPLTGPIIGPNQHEESTANDRRNTPNLPVCPGHPPTAPVRIPAHEITAAIQQVLGRNTLKDQRLSVPSRPFRAPAIAPLRSPGGRAPGSPPPPRRGRRTPAGPPGTFASVVRRLSIIVATVRAGHGTGGVSVSWGLGLGSAWCCCLLVRVGVARGRAVGHAAGKALVPLSPRRGAGHEAGWELPARLWWRGGVGNVGFEPT
jgi:hypothetical protein